MVPGAILMDGLLHSFCLGFVLALGLKYWEEYTEDSIKKRVFVLTVVFLSLYVLRRLVVRQCSFDLSGATVAYRQYWKIIKYGLSLFSAAPGSVHHKEISCSQRQNKAGNRFMWTDFFVNGLICSMCEAFYIRRCWKVRLYFLWLRRKKNIPPR
ncbi:hypothetical protein GGX14DRAFT_67611 [Mycena pura]|uniref:Uncharacterized protein n=1 Tax=Mycena pura TaxID=153505 RepID=A0AAD6YSU1_9AGAR|nr:hypothetical protein GGX14DRAFT_67611 [Mycena pura]